MVCNEWINSPSTIFGIGGVVSSFGIVEKKRYVQTANT